MKKIITAIAILMPLTAFAEIDFGVRVPEWKDFCPTAFIDVAKPKGMGKLNVTASYWYERKTEFEDAIVNCKALENNDERFSCYEDLKVKQYQKNSEYNARMEARASRVNGSIPEMNSMTDTMFPVNNYINTYTRFMPNELY